MLLGEANIRNINQLSTPNTTGSVAEGNFVIRTIR